MIIYGVYEGEDYDGGLVHKDLFKDEKKALLYAMSLIKKSEESTKKLKLKPFRFKKVQGENVWKRGWETIKLIEFNLI